MEGIARRVERSQEGATSVLRFVIEAPDGTAAAVEMRGEEIRGLLHEGDRVALVAGAQGLPADGIHRPRMVHNRTTRSTVTAWRPPRLARVGKPLLKTLGTALISSAATVLVGATFRSGGKPAAAPVGPGRDPGAAASDDAGTSFAAIALIVAAVLALGALAAFARRRRQAGRPLAPVKAGAALGVLIGLLIVGIAAVV